MREARKRQGQIILCQILDVRGRVRGFGVRVSEGRLPVAVRSWEGRVDGMESVLEEWVRHADGATIESDDVDRLKRDNLSRWDRICSPIPIRRSQVLGRGVPSVFINLVLARNIESMSLHDLLYDSMNIMVRGRAREKEEPRREQHRVCAKSGKAWIHECSIRPIETLRRDCCPQHHPTL
jgi:hypothetical protein